MDQDSKSVSSQRRKKREPLDVAVADVKKRQPRLPLYFPPDAQPLLTPFRVKALEAIYDIAYRELRGRIQSTAVVVESSDEDLGYNTLVLGIWADLNHEEWRQADRAVSDAVFDEEDSWTDEERSDYVATIRFEILPMKL